MKKIISCFSTLLFTLSLITSFGTYAQLSPRQSCQFTPNGVFDSVFDQYGNAYQLKDIAVNDTVRANPHHTIIPLNIPTYSSGYFKLYLDRNCGMENYATDTNHLARLKVVCQVLQDMSQFISSPCSSTEQTINIWCRDLGSIPNLPANSLGVMTSFYNVPLISGVSGIADNTIWKTLNSGVDAYRNVGVPWNSASMTGTTFFHGIFAFDFNNGGIINWNTSLSSAPTTSSNSYDLYTEVLHQAMHALGFASMISSNGNSILGATHPYYSRYDLNLKTSSGSSLLSHSGSVSMYNYSFGVSTSILVPGGTCYTDSTVCSTAIMYHGGLSTPQAVYTPNCFQPGISLSHFEDACKPTGSTEPMANNQYFLMSNITNPGSLPGNIKRYPQQEERQVLYDMGYSVNDHFGDMTNVNLNYIAYDSTFAPINQVVGLSDGLNNGAYTFSFDSSGNLTFTGSALLSNDIGVSGGSFEGLQLVSGSGTFSASSGSSGTSISLTGASDGISIFSYVPISSTGLRGNTVLGPLNKTSGVCSTNDCNLIPNPGFESASSCGQLVGYGTTSPATGSVSCWSYPLESPDLYSNGCTTVWSGSGFGFNIPNTNSSPAISAPPPLPGSTTNDHFIGLVAEWEQNFPIYPTLSLYATEAIQVSLATPLIGGTTYYGTLWAKIANNANQPLAFPDESTHPMVDLPGVVDIGLSNSTLANFSPALFFTIPTTITRMGLNLPVPAPASVWTPLHFTITPPIGTSYDNFIIYNAIDQNVAVWGNIYPINPVNYVEYMNYILIDNVRLTTHPIPTFTPPSSVHVCDNPLTDLGQYISNYSSITGGTFGGLAVTQTSNGTFTPSGITGPLPQTVTISYTYTDACGTNTIYANITVTNSAVTLSASPNPFCSGSSVTLSTSSCTTCTWAANGTNFCTNCSSSQSVSPTGTTTYTVTASGSNCAGSVTVNPLSASISISGPTIICASAIPTTTLTSSLSGVGYSYTWQISYDYGATWSTSPSTGTASITPTTATPGGIEFRVIVNTGSCTVTSAAVYLYIDPLPSATLGGTPTSICDVAGAYVELTAGPSSMTYSFDGGLSTNNPIYNISSPTGTSSHTVKVTDAYGCSATSSPVSVTLNVPPSVGAYAAPGGICIGQTVALTAVTTGASSVSWSPSSGANAVACATCASTTATPTSSTTYTVTATASNGCTTSAPVRVNVGTPPTVGILASLTNIYAGQSVILTGIGGPTYTWTMSPAGSPLYPLTANQSSVSVAPPVTTTYTLTANPSGCAGTASITINVTTSTKTGTPCNATTIFGGRPVAPTITGGTFGSLPSNTNYYVSGSFHLSGTMTISNSKFWIGPGVTIYIDNNAFVELSNCHFFTCLVNEDTWNGFAFAGTTEYSGGAGSLYLTNGTLIEDAEIGVAVTGTSPSTNNTGNYVIKSDGATFNRCLKAMDIESYYTSAYSGTVLAKYFAITNTVITSRNLDQYNNSSVTSPLSYPLVWPPLTGTYGLKTSYTPANSYLPPYNLVSPTAFQNTYPYATENVKSLGPAYYGIYMNNVGYSTGCGTTPQTYGECVIGDNTSSANRNIFDNLCTGIYNYNCDMGALNNTFMNMHYYSSVAPGDGIYYNSSGYCGRLRVWNNGGSGNNEFYDCITAVDAPNVSEIIGQNAKIISSLHNTTMLNQTNNPGWYGYNVKSWSFYNLDISTNNITNVTLGISATSAVPAPYISASAANGPMNISNNILNASAGSGVTNPYMMQGIYAHNLLTCSIGCITYPNVTISGNQVTGAYNGVDIAGYARQAMTGNSNTVAMNQVGSLAAQYGMKVVNCTGPVLRSNVVSGTSYTDGNWWSIYTETNTNLTAWCNNASTTGIGFEFRGNEPGTSWANNFMTNHGKGMVLNSGYIGPQVVVSSGTFGLQDATQNMWQTTGSFSWTGTNYNTWVTSTTPSNSLLNINSGGGSYLPGNNGSIPASYQYLFTPTVQVPIPGLQYNPHLAPSCTGLPGKLPQLAPFELIATAQVPYYSGTAINTWIDQMALWQAIQGDSTLIDSSAIVSEFATLATGSRYNALTNIESSLASGDVTTAESLISAMPPGMPMNDPVTGVVVADSAGDDYIVANYTSYYSLCIKVADSSMTGTDTAQLLALANLCPLTNGAVIYQARTLYDLVTNNPVPWANDSLCGLPHDGPEDRQAPTSAATMTASKIQSYSLYPNPNDGHVNLVQGLTDNNPVYAEVWDGVGRRVCKKTLLFANHRATVDVPNAVPGIYHIQLRDNDGKYYTFKFVVEK